MTRLEQDMFEVSSATVNHQLAHLTEAADHGFCCFDLFLCRAHSSTGRVLSHSNRRLPPEPLR